VFATLAFESRPNTCKVAFAEQAYVTTLPVKLLCFALVHCSISCCIFIFLVVLVVEFLLYRSNREFKGFRILFYILLRISGYVLCKLCLIVIA
jgi:hypothetical protein